MSFINRTPDSFSARRSPDDLDGLLRAFFRAEMPEPWPALDAPAAESVRVPIRPLAHRWTVLRSRFTLAASVLLLLGLSLFLAGRFADSSGSYAIGAGPDNEGLIATRPSPTKYKIEMESGNDEHGKPAPMIKKTTIEFGPEEEE